jgi:hypothetical protein
MFQFNMGKKFGGYSWLRSADSTRRRLEYYLANKWQRDGDTPGRVSCTGKTYFAVLQNAALLHVCYSSRLNWDR